MLGIGLLCQTINRISRLNYSELFYLYYQLMYQKLWSECKVYTYTGTFILEHVGEIMVEIILCIHVIRNFGGHDILICRMILFYYFLVIGHFNNIIK